MADDHEKNCGSTKAVDNPDPLHPDHRATIAEMAQDCMCRGMPPRNGDAMRVWVRGAFLASVFALVACGGGGASPAAPSAGAIVLGWTPQYLGFASSSCPATNQCLRPPAANTNVPVSQSGGNSFTVTSSDPSIATATIVMTGPLAQSDPAVDVAPVKAGSATMTITGAGGATAQLPVTVTTISTLTVSLQNLPSATTMTVSVNAPASANCPSFEGGYTFDVDASATTVLRNFPAMGSGPLAACVFSSVSFIVRDASYATLATKTVQLPIALGKDNPSSVTIP